MELTDDKDILELCNQVRQIAFDLHAYLRHGHLEKVYENGLVSRLRKAGWPPGRATITSQGYG